MAKIIDQVYHSLPIPFQQTVVATFGAWWFYRRYGGAFHRQVKTLQSRECWSLKQFHNLQLEALRQLLQSALKSKYYSSIISSSGLNPQRIESLEELNALPVLTKETLRSAPQSLLTSAIPFGTFKCQSSGTTGTPTTIFYTREFHRWNLAFLEARNRNWAEINYRDRRVMFGVRKVCGFKQTMPPFWRFSPIENMAYASVYHLSSRFIPFYIKFLKQYQPTYLMGYPSALYPLARYCIESGEKLSVQAVFTTSELVTPNIRQAIEKAWQTKVYDQYGCVEGCFFSSQCEFGSYHVSPDRGIIEILDANGNPCSPGQLGEVVCTGLQNFLQPLIRYKVGDLAAWANNQSCACGRTMPILERIEGRYEDLCVTQDGRQILRFDTVFKGIESIAEAQIIQQEPDYFEIRFIPTPSFNEVDRQLLLKNMQKHIGQARIALNEVPQIDRSKAGKFKAVICNLSPEEKCRLLKS